MTAKNGQAVGTKNAAHLSGLMESIKPPKKKPLEKSGFFVAILPGLNHMSIGGAAVTVKQDCVPVSTIMGDGHPRHLLPSRSQCLNHQFGRFALHPKAEFVSQRVNGIRHHHHGALVVALRFDADFN